jgi:hypothetical protein
MPSTVAPAPKKTKVGSSKKPIFKDIPAPIELSQDEFAGFMRFGQKETFPQLEQRLQQLRDNHPDFTFSVADKFSLPGLFKKFTGRNCVPRYVCSAPNSKQTSSVFWDREFYQSVDSTDTHLWPEGYGVLVVATRVA